VKKAILFAVIPLILLIGIIPAFSDEDDSQVLDWIKNNAKWWAEGKISSQEYQNAIKYLIENQIIDIKSSSINMLEPKNDFTSDVNYLKAILVEFSGGDLTKTITIDTFTRYNSGKDPTLINQIKELDYQSYFQLESLPSKDKTEFYNIISQYINPGKKPQPFDVKTSGIMSDGSILLSSFHKNCEIVDYSLYYQDESTVYQFSKEKQGEVRDHVLFYCGGANVGDIIHSPEDEENSQKRNMVTAIPENNDRVKSFVVHFFDGDLEQVYSFNTFKAFSPVFDSDASLYNSKPQFHLESLPSLDKSDFYKLLSHYINPVRLPQPFSVSIDAITGDGTILQRWNYVKCNPSDYTVYLEEYKSRYTFSGKNVSENIEMMDFECAGLHFQIYNYDKIENVPIYMSNWKQNFVAQSDFESVDLNNDLRAMTYQIRYFGGEMEQSHIYQNFPRVQTLSWKTPLVPVNHPNQYQHGFFVESNPSKDKSEIYQFLSRYINPGKTPEPFDVDLTIITGDGTVIYTHKYTNCSAVDFDWYLQDITFYYELSNIPLPEMRERYTNYCTGYTVEVP
jgi:hypothetical protein